MMETVEKYKARKIEFFDTVPADDWKVKVYCITNKSGFTSQKTLEKTISSLPKLLSSANKSTLKTYKTAFLIVHEAREGVWILLNWWTGGEMIQTEVYLSSYDSPETLEPSPYSNALLCVWELEVFAHERKAWINHILSSGDMKNLNEYLNDHLK